MYAYYKHWKRACLRIWTSEFILLLVCPFWDRVSQWSHCPEIHFVEEAGLELTETELPLPPKGWCERRTPHSAFNLWHGVLSFVLSGYSNITHTVAQLTSSLQKLNFCFWLSSARILGASHHTQPVLFYKKKNEFVCCTLYVWGFACLTGCAPCVGLVSVEVRRGVRSPGTGIMVGHQLVLAAEPGSSARTTNGLNGRSISPDS